MRTPTAERVWSREKAAAMKCSQMRCSSKFTMDVLSREAHSPQLPSALHAPVPLEAEPLLGGAPQQLLEGLNGMLGRALFFSPRGW